MMKHMTQNKNVIKLCLEVLFRQEHDDDGEDYTDKSQVIE